MLSLLVMATSPHKGLCKVVEVAACSMQVAVVEAVGIGLVNEAKGAAVGHDDFALPHRGPFLITEMGQCMLLKGVIALAAQDEVVL